MTVRKMRVEEEWCECDGCGYSLDKDNIPVSLKINKRWLHFHNAIDHGYDCFGYWVDKVLADGTDNDHYLLVSALFKQDTKVQRPLGV